MLQVKTKPILVMNSSNSDIQLVLGYTLAAVVGLVASINIIIIKKTPFFH